MTTTTTRCFARFALPIVSAGIIGGAALGLAGVANAGTYSQPQPNIVATPTVTAHPAPTMPAGARHIARLLILEPSYHP